MNFNKLVVIYCFELFNNTQINFFRPDVYFVTATQALTWITDPQPVKNLHNFEGWSCKKKYNDPGPSCNNANKCALEFKPAESNFTSTR